MLAAQQHQRTREAEEEEEGQKKLEHDARRQKQRSRRPEQPNVKDAHRDDARALQLSMPQQWAPASAASEANW
jgi:hypothetical protein